MGLVWLVVIVDRTIGIFCLSEGSTCYGAGTKRSFIAARGISSAPVSITALQPHPIWVVTAT